VAVLLRRVGTVKVWTSGNSESWPAIPCIELKTQGEAKSQHGTQREEDLAVSNFEHGTLYLHDAFLCVFFFFCENLHVFRIRIQIAEELVNDNFTKGMIFK
jgi:hypothetical protein